jgi:hypothetical protein
MAENFAIYTVHGMEGMSANRGRRHLSKVLSRDSQPKLCVTYLAAYREGIFIPYFLIMSLLI